jgi:hypothetical protein
LLLDVLEVVHRNRSLKDACNELHIERSGLSRRRRRIEELTDMDPSDPVENLNLMVAVYAYRLLEDRLPPAGDDAWTDQPPCRIAVMLWCSPQPRPPTPAATATPRSSRRWRRHRQVRGEHRAVPMGLRERHMPETECSQRVGELGQRLVELRVRRKELAATLEAESMMPPSEEVLAAVRAHIVEAIEHGDEAQRKALMQALAHEVRVVGLRAHPAGVRVPQGSNARGSRRGWISGPYWTA